MHEKHREERAQWTNVSDLLSTLWLSEVPLRALTAVKLCTCFPSLLGVNALMLLEWIIIRVLVANEYRLHAILTAAFGAGVK